MRSILLAAMTIALLSSCTNNHPSEVIFENSGTNVVNGRDVKANEDLWYSAPFVSITGAMCTGVLIKPNVVLTAAHCMRSNSVSVRFGNEFIQAVKVNCAQTYAHIMNSPMTGWQYMSPEQSDEHKLWDICALILKSNAPKEYSPIPIAEEIPAKGTEFIHVGWGQNTENSGTGTLRTGTSKFNYATEFTLESVQDPNGSKVCFGDSGGPVFIRVDGKLQVLGVLSAMFVAKDGKYNDKPCWDSTMVQTKRAIKFSSLWE